MNFHKPISRREFVRRTVAGSAGMALAGSGCARQGRVGRTVLITIDTLRADHVGCYGYPREVTPFIDSLAERSVVFQNAFASSSHTNPSHASILTSLHPVQHRLLSNEDRLLDTSIYTIAHMFRDAGYETAAFASVIFLVAFRDVFDTFDFRGEGYREANLTVNLAIDWLSRKTQGDRFLLWIHFYDPHTPYRPPKECLEKMRFASAADRERMVKWWTETQNIPMNFYESSDKLVEHLNNYNAEISFVDREIGRLFDFMEDRRLNSDTLWVITSDHGEGLGCHNYYKHSKHIYNEQLHVPLMLMFPDGEFANTKVDRLVRHVDILPTVAEILGTSLDKQNMSVQGSSLMPLIKNDGQGYPVKYAFSQRRPTLIGEGVTEVWEDGEIYCLQDLDAKYIYHSGGIDEYYRLRSDPFETRNVIDVESETKDKIKEIVRAQYDRLLLESEGINSGGIDKTRIEELKKHGYLQ